MSKAVDTAEQVVVIGLGLGLLYGGLKLYAAIQSVAGTIPKIGPIGPILSSREYTGPSGQHCRDDVGPLGTTTTCGAVPEPASIKSAPRDERIRYWIDHATDPKALLEALNSAGEDPALEQQVFIMAANHQASVGTKTTLDDDDKAYQDVMVWWANRRGDDRARAAAAARDWRALVGIAADLCQIEPKIVYGDALGDHWTDNDCAYLRTYAKGN